MGMGGLGADKGALSLRVFKKQQQSKRVMLRCDTEAQFSHLVTVGIKAF